MRIEKISFKNNKGTLQIATDLMIDWFNKRLK